MKTALDSNVLFDILLAPPGVTPPSEFALRQCAAAGALVVCEAVYSELAAYFASRARLDHFLNQLGIEREASVAQTLYRAGQAWKAYRQAGGPRERILTDFLIGAHAELQASQFLSRDRHFYRRYFPRLRVPVL